jgi:hypothetical protein
MSAPAGWYPQPDGRQRYWDGSAWTEHFHDPAAATPEAAETEQPSAEAPHVQTGYGQPQGETHGETQGQTYGQTHGQAYGQPGQSTPAYGAPAAGGSTGSSGLGKGCLIAGIVGFVVLALVVVLGIFLIRRAADDFNTGLDRVKSSQAAPVPDGSDGAEAPEGEGVAIGKGFTVGDIKVADGWTITKQDGIDFWTMNPTLTEPLPGDTILNVDALDGTNVIDTTVCTGSKGASKLNCLPFTEDVTGATSIVVDAF